MTDDWLDRMLDESISMLSEQILSSIKKAYSLRIRLHMRMAQMNGAEPEDMPRVVGEAISTGSEIIYDAVRKMSEVEKATDLAIKGE